MNALFECIEFSGVGIFESPTGTGKSLSLICSALHWLRKKEENILQEVKRGKKTSSRDISGSTCSSDGEVNTSQEPDWLLDIIENSSGDKDIEKKSRALSKYQEMLDQVTHARAREKITSGVYQRKRQFAKVEVQLPHVDDDEFLLDAYHSDDEVKIREDEIDVDEFEDGKEDAVEDNPRLTLNIPQIFYCSRTHSQISQFVHEIKKTAFKDARCITLGSRKNYCINSEVRGLSSDAAISEKCLELQKKRASSSTSSSAEPGSKKLQNGLRSVSKTPTCCEYRNGPRERLFVPHALSTIKDIEGLVDLGRATAAVWVQFITPNF